MLARGSGRDGYPVLSPTGERIGYVTSGSPAPFLKKNIALAYVQAQLLQTAQSAGCNAKHVMEQRLARWLLITADRAHRTTYKMSQEFLAHMLGSTRSTVSVTAGALKEEGLIEYSNGVIHILDRVQLERRSCECYRIIKDHLDNYAEYNNGFST